MFAPPKYPEKPWFVALVFVQLGFSYSLQAQNLTLYVTENEQSRANEFLLREPLGIMKGGISYDLAITTMYDSNVRLEESDAQDDFSLFVSPTVAYVSDPEGGARYSFGAAYSPVARAYLNESSLNDINQNGHVSFRFQGSKTLLTLAAGYNEVSAADRFTGEFSEGKIFRFNIFGSYQVAPRTSISASWSHSKSDYDTDENVGADVNTSQIGATWDATERLSFGASLRQTLSESDNTGTREAYALLGRVDYKLGERLYFSASAGPELSENSRGGGDGEIGFTGELAAKYAMNDRWSWTASMRYVTLPSPTDLNYIVNDFSFSTGLSRELLRGSIGFGLDLGFSEYEAVGEASPDRENEDNLSLYINYNRILFSERVTSVSTIRYVTNDGRKDYDQWQLSTGLTIAF